MRNKLSRVNLRRLFFTMSDGYRNGAFSLGLITGIGITLNLFLWIDFLAQQEADQQFATNHPKNYSQVGNWWQGFLEMFVDPNDSLAQWIMAIFTILAVILVYRTLKATQAMATQTQIMAEDTRTMADDTRLLGMEQIAAVKDANSIARLAAKESVRPIILIQNDTTNIGEFINGSNNFFKWDVEIKNIGAQPAFVNEVVNQGFFAYEDKLAEAIKVHPLIPNTNFSTENSNSQLSIHDVTEIITKEGVSQRTHQIMGSWLFPSEIDTGSALDVVSFVRSGMLGANNGAQGRFVCVFLYTFIRYRDLSGTEYVISRLFRQTAISYAFSEQGGKDYNYRS